MLSVLFSRLIILLFGTLYPAYASYKAIRTKNVKEYVKWMMYWIVFGFFTCIETFTDIFCSWFPFYYEVKIIIVLWLLSPATKGSSTLYRKFVHPMLTRHEEEIDQYISQAKERGYSVVFQLGTKGVNYATNVIMQTAIKGGGNLVQTFKKSYSLSDISETDSVQAVEEINRVNTVQPQQRILRPRAQAALARSASGSRHSTGMYFTEVNVTNRKQIEQSINVRSAEDISSGYSSAEAHNLGAAVVTGTTHSTSTMKTRARARKAELVEGDGIYEDDEDMLFDDDFQEASVTVLDPNNKPLEYLRVGFTDLIAAPPNMTTQTYTIDARQIQNLIRLMDMKSETSSLVSEDSIGQDLETIEEETFVDCSNQQLLVEGLRTSTKKRRAPPPPTPSPPPIIEEQQDEIFLDTINTSRDTNQLTVDDDEFDLSFRKRSKSDTFTTTSSNFLKGFTSTFFRMSNTK